MGDILNFNAPVKLNEDLLDTVKDFDCDNDDLNSFLKDDAMGYLNENLATTYLCIHPEHGLLAYFCISADSIEIDEEEKKIFEKYNKGLRNYPAIKIGRLAVQKEYCRMRIGKKIIQMVVGRARAISEDIGVRYISVDPYPQAIDFYSLRL